MFLTFFSRVVNFPELLRDDEDRTSKRNYVYYLAVAHARIKQYDLALGYIDVLLDAEGDNQQAKTLKESIKSAMTHGKCSGKMFGSDFCAKKSHECALILATCR